MFMKQVLFITLVLSTLFSCQKDESFAERCYEEQIGFFTITNQSTNPYDVWIDGQLVGRLDGQKFISDYEVAAGTHSVYVKQVSGYLLFPTEITKSFTLTACQELGFVFP